MAELSLLKLKRLIAECDKHQQRMQFALCRIEPKLPLTRQSYLALDDEDISHIDQFLFRFSKLQDALGQRFFKAILELLEEDVEGIPFIDILNKLEKLNLIESATQWQELREIRNAVSHEYEDSPELMAQVLNTVFSARVELFQVYDRLKAAYQERQSDESRH